MRIAREVALYNQGGIQNGIDTAEDRASKVATSFITRVSEAEGIKVHNADDLTDYIQINSNGVDLVNDNVSIANFGESARVGKTDSSRFMINADSLEAYDDNNEKYFEVTPTSMTYGVHTVSDTAYADGKASAAQSAAISAAAADATAKANEAAKTATNFITTDSTGIKVHNTNDTSNYTHIGSAGMDVYQGGDLSASFNASGVQIGKDADTHLELDASGMHVADADGVMLVISADNAGTDIFVPNNSDFAGTSLNAGGDGHANAGLVVTGSGGAGAWMEVEADDNRSGFAVNLSPHGSSYTDVNIEANTGSSPSSGYFRVNMGNSALLDMEYNRYVAIGDSGMDVDIDGYLRNNNKPVMMLKVSKSSVSSLSTTITHSAITSDMEVVHTVLSNPSAQTGDWTVTTSNGSLTIAGSISGTTNITLYLAVPRT